MSCSVIVPLTGSERLREKESSLARALDHVDGLVRLHTALATFQCPRLHATLHGHLHALRSKLEASLTRLAAQRLEGMH
jgi:hypothetical protein